MVRKKRSSFATVLLLAVTLIGTSFLQWTPTAHSAPNEDYVWKNVNTGAGGGFIPGIIFNESEEDLIYARTDIGGAYRWNSSDNSWIQLTRFVGWDDWNKNGIDGLATDPVDPDRLYLLTGMYTNEWDHNNGNVLISTDRGNSFVASPLPFKVGGNMPGRSMGERLVIDPNRNNILYLGARSGNGLWRSTNFGQTWSKVTSFPNPGTYIPVPGDSYQGDIMGIAWIAFDRSTGSPGSATQTIYVGVADPSNNIFRSTDGGVTWQAVPGQPTGFLPHHGVLAVSGILYVNYSNDVGPYGGSKGQVWKLDTSTGVWTEISPVDSDSEDNWFGYGGLAVDPQDPDTLMVSSMNAWWPDEKIFRSTDGGATWTSIWDWNGYPSRSLRYTQDISAAPWLDFAANPQPPETTPKLGWMIGDIEIDPFNSDRMMYGTGATLYGTNNLTDWDNGGKINISVMAKGIEEEAVTSLLSTPIGPEVISGVFDVSGFRHDDVTKVPSRMMINPKSTASMDYAELDPAFIVRVGTYDTNYPDQKLIGISRDSASNWYSPNSQPSTQKGGGTVALAADGSSIVWSIEDAGVQYSKTGGNSWSASTGLPAGAKVASDRVNKDKFYAISGGTFYISTNGGASFAPTAASGLPVTGNLKALPGTEGDIWLAGGSTEGVYGLWHSTNSGASFTRLTNVEEADVVGFGKEAPGRSYKAIYTSAKIDGVRGIFRSIDAGASWVRINDDQHQYGVTNSAITGDPKVFGRVYLGTNGHGIVYGDPVNTTPNPDPDDNSVITPISAQFDKHNPANISVALTLNGNTLTSIRNGSTVLVSGTDYTVSGTTVSISEHYLAAQALGLTHLTFVFSAGNPATLGITINDTTEQPPATGDIKVQMFNGSLASSVNTLNPRIKLTNTGSNDINLSTVQIRYYYTSNGNQDQQLFVDWSSAGTGNVTGTFVKLDAAKPTADTYAAWGFTSEAGVLAAGQSIEIQTRISKTDWSNYSQSDDYSFNATATAYVDSPLTTAYIDGTLAWGLEP